MTPPKKNATTTCHRVVHGGNISAILLIPGACVSVLSVKGASFVSCWD